MAYATWSVVFGEQPSASKWNILGTNDAYFNTQVGSDFSSGTTSTLWWEELGRTTLGGTGDSISVSVAARKYLKVMYSCLASGSLSVAVQFNTDTAGNYTYRSSLNGVGDGTATAQTSGQLVDTATQDSYGEMEIVNISAKEKIAINHAARFATGTGAAPSRVESVVKWVNTSDQITSVQIINTGAGDFASGSQAVVIGHD